MNLVTGASVWHGRCVAVVIPAFNEERWIARTVRGVPAYVDRIVVVDDASVDATSEQVASIADPRLIRVRHRNNRGVGAAIVTGYMTALRHGADVLAVMAGDDQMRPEELPSLLDSVIRDRADYAKGNRLIHPLATSMPPLRRWGTRTLAWLTRRATGLQVGDSQCGYTALCGEMAAALPLAELWPRYGYPNDLLALLADHGAQVRDVAVSPVYAEEASGLHAGHMLSIACRIWSRSRASKGPARNESVTEGVDAPSQQGARSRDHSGYSSDEQRR